ncbi:MAG: protease complex subunit PrcB family protein [Acidobacteria bacterium]|nr:protease complex subunit PrcB family protein [Acidobacteriota bacterium]
MKRLSLYLLLSAVVAVGCVKRDNTSSGQTPTSPSRTTPVTFQRVTRGSRSAVVQQTTLVATNDRTFDDILARVVPDQPILSPNFAHEMAVAVFLGERLTGGFQIRVTNVTDTDGVLTVEALETIPNLRCAVIQSLTQPFEIISVPRRGDSVVLLVAREVGPPCF